MWESIIQHKFHSAVHFPWKRQSASGLQHRGGAGVGHESDFYPFVKNDDCFIIELKATTRRIEVLYEAIRQIKDQRYALRFEGKIGENPEYTGRILAVGIAYSKDHENKLYACY